VGDMIVGETIVWRRDEDAEGREGVGRVSVVSEEEGDGYDIGPGIQGCTRSLGVSTRT
jgi:hypothetical protein